MTENAQKKSKGAELRDRVLKSVEMTYSYVVKGIKVVKEKVPQLYNDVESVIKAHIISFDLGKKLKARPNFNQFSKVVAFGVTNRLSNIDEKKLSEMVKSKSSKSFLDMFTRGIGDSTVSEKEFTKIKRSKLFERVLVANRGEIALRVVRACRELGIKSIQVYTKQDSNSLAVKFADKSVKLGNDASAYLDMEKIIKVAKKYKIDAVHPGYGFLAENPEFVRLCEKNRIKFIGPSYKAIKVMGDKVNAKKLIRDAGIAILQGTDEATHDAEQGKKVALEIGFPVIIKATAGGGGKGMRIVQKLEEFEESFKACRAEAEVAFKNKDVFIEKYLIDPKHIEVQILTDKKGNLIHLGERDCSIQRRHQKLIEEAPSPALDVKLREKIGEAALKISSAIKYEGAGTVEFLLDKDGNFYFMEMNTRIQVEHGITEMITGIDLVKEQIKIAAGAQLMYKQEDIKIEGWAIECRINAECPVEGFCPTTGKITNYLPTGGPGIRVCSSCHVGQEVSPHYDPLLAKLMCAGKTRAEAIDRMKRALNEFIIEGVETTIPFHKVVLDNKSFQKGDITTSFIEKNRIIEKMKSEFRQRKKILSQEEKAIIISTAISEYLKKKNRFNDKNCTWVQIARQEAVIHE